MKIIKKIIGLFKRKPKPCTHVNCTVHYQNHFNQYHPLKSFDKSHWDNTQEEIDGWIKECFNVAKVKQIRNICDDCGERVGGVTFGLREPYYLSRAKEQANLKAVQDVLNLIT